MSGIKTALGGDRDRHLYRQPQHWLPPWDFVTTIASMLAWLRIRLGRRRKVAADADELIKVFGSRAYGEARDRARPSFSDPGSDFSRRNMHWDRVRREIGRRILHSPLDPATWYLSEP